MQTQAQQRHEEEINDLKYKKFYTHMIGISISIIATIATIIPVLLSIVNIIDTNNNNIAYVIIVMGILYAICMITTIMLWRMKVSWLSEEIKKREVVYNNPLTTVTVVDV